MAALRGTHGSGAGVAPCHGSALPHAHLAGERDAGGTSSPGVELPSLPAPTQGTGAAPSPSPPSLQGREGRGRGRQARGADEEEKVTRTGSRGVSISRGSLAQTLAELSDEVGGENSFPIIQRDPHASTLKVAQPSPEQVLLMKSSLHLRRADSVSGSWRSTCIILSKRHL